MTSFKNPRFMIIVWLVVSITWLRCEPWVEQFEEIGDAVIYTAEQKSAPPSTVETITVMTWNIRFGAGRIPWFGDSCGDRVILTKDEVFTHLQGIANKINEIQPDVLIINEIDIESKRSAYIDQMQWLLDHTYFNYGAFASVWKVQFIPSDGLGRMNMGNAVLSRWPILEAIRIPLPQRGDQDELTKYFYLRRNILKVKIDLPNVPNFYAVNVHTSAFAKDDTKMKHIDIFKAELDELHEAGAYFVAGGDLNTLPPGATKTYFCLEDRCFGEDVNEMEGCDFTKEVTWLQDLYDTYQSAVPLDEYLTNEERYFTNTSHWDGFWQKKLDYLFTNYQWIAGSDSTHQEATDWSDHTPISVRWGVPE
ncbi:endonuclease/exonuclease/phosphatase family protein [candidate division KSB1 bacterium]|nr:endonuclease/exonuclease/phosphatase family protein [candidate division KSB1 bacterium]